MMTPHPPYHFRACPKYAGDLEPVFRQLDNCLVRHGVATARSGSALTDLLLIDPSQPKTSKAISACQQYVQAG